MASTFGLLWAAGAGVVAAQTTIGVLSAPSSARPGSDYIPASYVDWVQAAGAMVVPLPSGVRWTHSSGDWTLEASPAWSPLQYDAAFRSINGLVLLGGDPWPQVASLAFRQLYDLAVRANADEDYFPIWGTCAGFETLMVFAAGGCQANVSDGQIPTGSCAANGPISRGFDSQNASWPLDLTEAALGSRLFGEVPPSLLAALQVEPLTMNSHSGGVDVAKFYDTENLAATYTVLSTNVDRKNRTFVSTVEGVTLPFYGTQWHPEKSMFEWGDHAGRPFEAINHSPNAMSFARYLADFLVGQARRSRHGFPSPSAALAASIYNYVPSAYDPAKPQFTRTYFFDWATSDGIAGADGVGLLV